MITYNCNYYINCVARKSEENAAEHDEDFGRGNIFSDLQFSLKFVCVSENRCEKKRCEERSVICYNQLGI